MTGVLLRYDSSTLRRGWGVAAVAFLVIVSGASAAGTARLQSPKHGRGATKPLLERRLPLIGANYTHYAISGCELSGTGIIAGYDKPGVRAIVRSQLATMRHRGLLSLRLLLWHTTDTGRHDWGVVQSAAGNLSDPARSNLIHYLQDVTNAGFRKLTVAFGPVGANNPRSSAYSDAKGGENWHFIQSTRPLVKRYGPPSTRMDLLNEGAPSSFEPPAVQDRLRLYLMWLFRHYVDVFGDNDVVISASADSGGGGRPSRLENLIGVLDQAELPLPRWFEIHLGYDELHARADLETADFVLRNDHLDQPIVIGETPYNDSGVARIIRSFMRTKKRRILEVLEWPLTRTRSCRDMSVSPPYQAGAYLSALRG